MEWQRYRDSHELGSNPSDDADATGSGQIETSHHSNRNELIVGFIH
ncbi:unnamed protein product [Protopolystoma xenopodis]|uniref:Uncharacterized protein n=1 Tax=Protopolystoma xenopodis TaxID=117903 RepID=A0A448X0J6_9PLAT|nr:unnamed protein product [Protopolystoma xenopodis]